MNKKIRFVQSMETIKKHLLKSVVMCASHSAKHSI